MSRRLFLKKSERGQSLTELAVSLTFILILLAGVVDIGRAFFTYITLRDAAQEGALYGSYYLGQAERNWCGIIERVRATSNSPFNLAEAEIKVEFGTDSVTIPPGSYTCSKDLFSPSAGDQVRVTVTKKDFQITMPFIGTLIGKQTLAISASIRDRVLTNAIPYP